MPLIVGQTFRCRIRLWVEGTWQVCSHCMVPAPPPTPGPWCHLHDPAIPGRVGHLWPLLPSGLKIWCWVVVKKSRNTLFKGCHLWRKKKNSTNHVHGIDSSCEPMFLFNAFPLASNKKRDIFYTLYHIPHPVRIHHSPPPSQHIPIHVRVDEKNINIILIFYILCYYILIY